jgi:hypothetical protein
MKSDSSSVVLAYCGGFILNATLDLNAPEHTVGIDTGLTCQLLHAVAELLVPVLPKVLPSAKRKLVRLSLILKSDCIPSLQALGEIPLDNLDEDVVFVIRGAKGASGTTTSHPWLKNKLEKYSGISVGRPTDLNLLQND